MQLMNDLRAAVDHIDEAVGCPLSTPHVRVEANAFTALYKVAKAFSSAQEPRERWVDADGVTRLPKAMREELRVGDGVHIWFLRGSERWEAWREDEMGEVYGGEDQADIEIAEKRLQEVNADPSLLVRLSPEQWELKTCWCFRCLDEPSMGPRNPAVQRMIVCPQCGNKRCPRATSHDNACSGNEPGQDGSEK